MAGAFLTSTSRLVLPIDELHLYPDAQHSGGGADHRHTHPYVAIRLPQSAVAARVLDGVRAECRAAATPILPPATPA